MEWYRVIKTIHGRKYLYWQKTYRQGGSVKTLNKYIGPVSGHSVVGTLRSESVKRSIDDLAIYTQRSDSRGIDDERKFLSKRGIAPDRGSPPADPKAFTPVSLEKRERIEDERIQYGSRAARVRKQKSKLAAAKRATRGVKKLNPFIAQAHSEIKK